MSVYNVIINKKEKVAIVGLGYVGLPIAIEFSNYVDVVEFDIDKTKITAYKNWTDLTGEVMNIAYGGREA